MIVEDLTLRNKPRIFRDRSHAGEVLAKMLAVYRGSRAVVLGVPAGGLPVAAAVARSLCLPLEIAAVSKVVAPGTNEIGCGAVAFDGTAALNHDLISGLELTQEEIREVVDRSSTRVMERYQRLRGHGPLPNLTQKTSILVDEGLASGFLMQAAIHTVRNAGASSVIVAVPTAHEPVLQEIAGVVDVVYCANVKSGCGFAVADAYSLWTEIRDIDFGRVSMYWAEKGDV